MMRAKGILVGSLVGIHLVGAGVVLWLSKIDPLFAKSGLKGFAMGSIIVAAILTCGTAALACYAGRWRVWLVLFSVLCWLFALGYAAIVFLSVFLSAIGQPHVYDPSNNNIVALYLWPILLITSWMASLWVATTGSESNSQRGK
jgi:hypothetical protein